MDESPTCRSTLFEVHRGDCMNAARGSTPSHRRRVSRDVDVLWDKSDSYVVKRTRN